MYFLDKTVESVIEKNVVRFDRQRFCEEITENPMDRQVFIVGVITKSVSDVTKRDDGM